MHIPSDSRLEPELVDASLAEARVFLEKVFPEYAQSPMTCHSWLLSPMLGAAAMSMSSVFVVTNALRLRFFKPRSAKQPVETVIKIEEEKEMETIIHVEGMMCPHCKARVESVCKAVNGAQDAVVDLQEKIVTVTGDADVSALKKAITDAGYEVVQ